MARAYKGAIASTQKRLDELDDALRAIEEEGGDPSEYMVRNRQRLLQNIDEYERELKRWQVEGRDIVMKAQRDAIRITFEGVPALLDAAAGPMPEGARIPFVGVTPERVETIVGFASDGSPLAQLFDEIGSGLAGELRDAFINSAALGLGARQTARAMRETVGDLGRYRAETIARTEMLRAAREAHRRMYHDNPAVTGYTRMAAQDGRVCLACLALSGQRYSTAEIMPTHPNCRCVMIPDLVPMSEILNDPSFEDDTPPPFTPDILMAGLTDDEVKGIFGPARYEQWKNGKELREFVEVDNHPRWGPTVSIRPLNR